MNWDWLNVFGGSRVIDRYEQLLCKSNIQHYPQEDVELAGISMKSKCKHCKGTILLDSQSNWFVIADEEV